MDVHREIQLSAQILIGGICERDLDLFLLEECVSNGSFLSWLLSQIPDWPADSRQLLSAARSVNQTNGESDLELNVSDPGGRIGKLLIENKLDAGFQPEQLARYRERAAMYVRRGDCAYSAVMLFAPDAYTHRSSAKVAAVISYEAVEAWLAATGSDHRTGYKLKLLRSALAKHRLGYNPETDQPVTDFWGAYWREAEVTAPQLQLAEPGPKPAAAGFVWFFPAGLPGDLNICHKLPKGFVDLHFADWGNRVSTLKAQLQPLLDAEMEVVRASKSAAVRIPVSVVNTGRPFLEQIDSVREALGAAKRLYSWANRHRSVILEISHAAAGRSPGDPEDSPAGRRSSRGGGSPGERVDRAYNDPPPQPDDGDDNDHPPIPARSRWRQFVLHRESSLHHEPSETSIQALQVLERIDRGADPEDPDFRIWALGIFDDRPWSMLEGQAAEGHCIRILFPTDNYHGMPPHLDIERPRKPRIGGAWRLLRPDGRPAGIFVLRELSEVTYAELRFREAVLMKV
jgi:hypothetical protein